MESFLSVTIPLWVSIFLALLWNGMAWFLKGKFDRETFEWTFFFFFTPGAIATGFFECRLEGRLRESFNKEIKVKSDSIDLLKSQLLPQEELLRAVRKRTKYWVKTLGPDTLRVSSRILDGDKPIVIIRDYDYDPDVDEDE